MLSITAPHGILWCGDDVVSQQSVQLVFPRFKRYLEHQADGLVIITNHHPIP